MIVQFTAPFLDHSGYGEASRNTLMAMVSAGIKVTTKIASFTVDKLKVGEAGKLAINLEKKYQDYNINLVELTPEHFPFFKEKDKYNIGYFFCLVKGVDPKWISWCNLMDELWLPSPSLAEIFKKAGVAKPIKIIPCSMDTKNLNFKPFVIPIKKPRIIFYSIFQWTERKNPQALLKTYWKTFEGIDDVLLMIKTYRNDFSKDEQEAVKKEVFDWKKQLGLKTYPKLWLVFEDMSYEEIMSFHSTGDIFVSAHRGEGWGYPQMVAMAFV